MAGAAPRRVRRPGRDPAQRAVRRRAPRSVAPHPPRRRVGGGRHAVGGVRADRGPRARRRRRGARHVVQAGREPALPRARRGDRARRSRPARWRCSARRRRRSRRFSTRSTGQVRAGDARAPHPRSAAGVGPRRRHARGVRRAKGRTTVLSPAAARRAGRAARRDGEQSVVLLNRRGYAAAYFCRACAASLECPHCSITLTVHRAARRAVCHYCDYGAAAAAGVPDLRRRVPRLSRRRHRADRGGGAGGAARRAHRPRRSRHDAAARRDRRACCGASRRASSTSWSGRR